MSWTASQPRSMLRFHPVNGWRGPLVAPLRHGRPNGAGNRCRGNMSIRASAEPEVKWTGLGKYLSDSFMRIFSVPEDENISWENMYLPFEGKLEKHDDKRLRRLHEVVQAVKGCTDPSAENYAPNATVDDGSCVYTPGEKSPPLEDYLKGAIERVVGHQFKGEDTEPEYGITPFSGQILSKRETERLLTFAKVVEKTMKEVEEEDSK